jgi:predicted enzyme related to lactoylglutathione lyase
MDSTKIKGISMANVYTHDFERAYTFYADILGLKDDKYKKEKNHYYFQICKEAALFIEGGYEEVNLNEKSSRASFTFDVESVKAMYNKLKDAGYKLIQNEPMKMQENIYWFQCLDPDGNFVEFLGGE